jgi:tetrahydromethanopterin S-methyltransferase subunit G
MNQPKKLPDPEKLKRTHERFQETNRQLEILDLKLAQLNAMMEIELCQQRLERLERRKKFAIAKETQES